MVSVEDLIEWAESLPPETLVGIDESGIGLVTEDLDGPQFDIGSMPFHYDELCDIGMHTCAAVEGTIDGKTYCSEHEPEESE